MQDAKEEVRSRLNIEDVIGEYVVLKRAGRNFKGLSPFTGEKTPSFYVSPDKQIWHDFSSNKGGDVFSFVMEAEGADFRQCLELLARKAGVDLSMYDTGKNRSLGKRKEKLKEVLKLSTKYYQASFVNNKHAIDYVFHKRGLNRATITEFMIGYAPSSGDALVKFLAKKGYEKKDMQEAGLLNRFGSDLFRSRIMVPLMDISGEVIGFTGRLLEDEPNSPKYLNTPQTILYDKSRHVFGLSQAKESIRNADRAVIVEGNLDVISSFEAGVKNVVATAGTAMTEMHLKAIGRITKQIKLCFDSDKAGIAATERAISIAQNVDVDLSIISLPESAKDPDELVKQDIGLWRQAIDDAEPAIDWVLKQYQKRYDVSSANGKREFTSSALNLIRQIDDPVVKEHYIKNVADTIGASKKALNQKLDSNDSNELETKTRKSIKPESQGKSQADEYSYHDNALAIGLSDGATRDLFNEVDEVNFQDEARLEVLRFVKTSKERALEDIQNSLQKYDTYVKILLLKAETRYADFSSQDRYFEAARLLRQIEIQNKKNQKDKLTEELRTAEDSRDEATAQELRKRIHVLIKEIQIGKR